MQANHTDLEEAEEASGWTEKGRPREENEQDHHHPLQIAGTQAHEIETEALLEDDLDHLSAETDLQWVIIGVQDPDRLPPGPERLLALEVLLDVSHLDEMTIDVLDHLRGGMKGSCLCES